MVRTRSLLMGWGLGLIVCIPLAARAEDYPSKPVKIIVSLAPGGLADMFARLLAQHMSETTKQTVVVENRTGGAGIVGAEAAGTEGCTTSRLGNVAMWTIGTKSAAGS